MREGLLFRSNTHGHSECRVRTLVTGADGFVGARLTSWLVRRGHNVRCTDAGQRRYRGLRHAMAARAAGAERFILASTCAVYGCCPDQVTLIERSPAIGAIEDGLFLHPTSAVRFAPAAA